MSDMFYYTADGVKVNTAAIQELTEAEYELQATNLRDEIEATRQEMAEALPGSTIYDAAKDKLDQLMQTQSQFFVQFEQMKSALSDFNELQIALQTENQGAVYDSINSTYENIKQAYEKGLIGTDDFKAFTKFADAYGRDTIEAFNEVKPKLDRYLTEDGDVGTDNFLADLKALGLA
jgi:hypothetical protein